VKILRLFVILICTAAMCAATVHAAEKSRLGAGVILGDPSGITLRFGHFPVLAFGWSGINGRLHLNLDYWLINRTLEGSFDWYFGLGGKIWIWGGSGPNNTGAAALGARAPLGLQWYMAEDWELFLEIAPGLEILPNVNFWWDAGLGLRYYF
jgi:hypothetical protein